MVFFFCLDIISANKFFGVSHLRLSIHSPQLTLKGLPCSCVMSMVQTSIQTKRYSHGLTPNTTCGGIHDDKSRDFR